MIFLVNNIIVSISKMILKLGVMKASANHAAERLPVTVESDFRNARFVFVTGLV